MALSVHFLIVGTASGIIQYWQCQEKALLSKYKHTGGGVLQVFPQPSGTRFAVFFSDCAQMFDCRSVTNILDWLACIRFNVNMRPWVGVLCTYPSCNALCCAEVLCLPCTAHSCTSYQVYNELTLKRRQLCIQAIVRAFTTAFEHLSVYVPHSALVIQASICCVSHKPSAICRASTAQSTSVLIDIQMFASEKCSGVLLPAMTQRHAKA